MGGVLRNLGLHKEYHQRVKNGNHSKHPILWLIVIENLTSPAIYEVDDIVAEHLAKHPANWI